MDKENSERSNGIGAFLKEIEEAFGELLPIRSQEQHAIDVEKWRAWRFVHEHSQEFRNDAVFINSFSNPLQQEAVIKTLQYLRDQEKAKIRKTHKHREVIKEIETAQLNNPDFTVTKIIECVAEKLNMTPRTVKHHYYNPR